MSEIKRHISVSRELRRFMVKNPGRMNDRTPEAWIALYEDKLARLPGLTAREWDHYGEMKRAIAQRPSTLPVQDQTGGAA